MVCPRCGATFVGNFCPQCGTPALLPPPSLPAVSVTCARCGTTYAGHFCPRCGLPAGAPPFAPPPAGSRGSPDLRRVLSVLWTLSLVGFFIFIAMNFAGLILSPAYVVPGIQGISSGQDANQALTAGNANWTFQALNASTATGTYVASGGNPDGYLEMTLPAGSTVGGEWVQSVQLTGSAPFAAEVQLDYRTPIAGKLVVSVEPTPSGLNYSGADAIVTANASATWQTTDPIAVSNSIGEPGTYYLKVALLAEGNPAPVTVGFDNIRMKWVTDAVFYFYLPAPVPQLLVLLYISQDPAQFLAYFGFIVVAILAAGAWYTWRDRRATAKAFMSPLDNISARLKSMSGWVSIAQVWLATTFFQYALIIVLEVIGPQPTTPFTQTTTNAWTLLFDYSAASVFEEIAFRMFLIGVPMAAGAFLFRLARGRPSTPAGTGAARSNLLHSLRYLWGGQLRRESSREARLVGVILVLVSGTIFGLAHAPGWGWWKVLPALVVGLGMGYVFVRHGIGASILLHFATDGSLALYLEGIGGVGLALFSDLFYLGLAIAGSGFFVWYILYGWEELQDLRRSFQARIVRQPIPAGYPPAVPPGNWSYAPPPVGLAGRAPPPSTPVPPPSGYPPPPPPPVWPPPAAATASPVRGGAQIPQGYAPTYHPPPYGYPPVRFQCPYCGWVEARYENHTFTCLRCGRTA